MSSDLPSLSNLSGLRSNRPAQADVGALQHLVKYQQTDLILDVLNKLSDDGLYYFVSVALIPKSMREGYADIRLHNRWWEMEDGDPRWKAMASYDLELKFYKVSPPAGSSVKSPGFLMKKLIDQSFLPRISRALGSRSTQKPTQNGSAKIVWTEKDVLDSATLGYDTYRANMQSPLNISLDVFCDAVEAVKSIFDDIPDPLYSNEVVINWEMELHDDPMRAIRSHCAGVLFTVKEAATSVAAVNQMLFRMFRRGPADAMIRRILRDRAG